MGPKRKIEEDSDNAPQGKKPKSTQQFPQSNLAQANGPVIDIADGFLFDAYGELFEGLHAARPVSEGKTANYRRRWRARHQLAQLSTQPDGFGITLRYPDGRTQTAHLLTPPDMVVEQDGIGQLQRRQRIPLLDGDEPYSQAFYQRYLTLNRLPYFLFRQGHLAMLEDMAEARILGIDVPEPPQQVVQLEISPAQRVRIRRTMRRAHIAGHGIVNPTEIPAGLGHWEWLGNTDRDVAEASGYGSSFEDITTARGAGALSLNSDREDVPAVVWYPDLEYLNPADEPDGSGHWEFMTSTGQDSDRGMAALQLGGTSGLPDYPSARQIFLLRLQYQDENREDLTADIRLVWIPGEDAESEGDDPVLEPLPQDDSPGLFVTSNTPSPEEGEEEAEEEVTHGFLGEGVSPSDFDPTNGDPGGKTNQTATKSTPKYYTCRIPPVTGKVITLDRARPQLGVPEEHKTYTYNLGGWIQYATHARLDWSDKAQVGALARWRDQINRRNGWPQLRGQVRERYSDEERRWVDRRVVAYLKAGRDYAIVHTHRGFNAKFSARGERSEAGVASLMLRMKRHWLQFGTMSTTGLQQNDESDVELEPEQASGQADNGADADVSDGEQEHVDVQVESDEEAAGGDVKAEPALGDEADDDNDDFI